MKQNQTNLGRVSALFWLACFLVLVTAISFPSQASTNAASVSRCFFIPVKSFEEFEPGRASNRRDATLLSPEYSAPLDWNELVVSWNVKRGVALVIEARLVYPDHTTGFYNLGEWSDDLRAHPRRSGGGQANADAEVKIDTLVLKHPGAKVQIRLTLVDPKADAIGALKFLGLSFCNRAAKISGAPLVGTVARGNVLEVPELRQGDYLGGGGWCSPTSLSMVLAYWGDQSHRPELNHTVPEVAASIYDAGLPGTGNWPFNTAYAGSFDGMRAYVIRMDDARELEQWVAAGIPPIVSVSSYLTRNRHSGPDEGHLIVLVGFDANGDAVVNDPGVSVKPGSHARRTYPRDRFCAAWKHSGNTVYLIYPENKAIPANTLRHWDSINASTISSK